MRTQGRRPKDIVSPGNGHAIVCVGPNDMTEPPMPEILAHEQEIRPEVGKRLGPQMGLVSPVVGTLFPNFSWLRVGSRTFRVWHPRGPDKIEVLSWVYSDKAAPPHGKEAIRLAGIGGGRPFRQLGAGRHGQLAGMHPRLSRTGVAASFLEHADGART